MTEAETVLVAPSGPTPDRTPTRTRSRERRLAAVDRRLRRRERHRRRWPWPPRAPCPATPSTRSSAASRTPRSRCSSGDDDKGAALLDNAAGRLDEVGELSRDGDGRAADITATLDDFSAQATEASDLLLDDYADTGRVASLEELRGVHRRQPRGAREPRRRRAARGAASALVEAAQTVTRIDEQAVGGLPDLHRRSRGGRPGCSPTAPRCPTRSSGFTGASRPARRDSDGGTPAGADRPAPTAPRRPAPVR